MRADLTERKSSAASDRAGSLPASPESAIHKERAVILRGTCKSAVGLKSQ